MAGAVRLGGLVFSNFGDFVELGTLHATRAWERFTEGVRRLSGWLGEWIAYGIRSGLTIAQNLFAGFGRFAGDFINQLANRISAQVKNVMADLPGFFGGGSKKIAVPAIAPHAALFGNPLAGVGAAPKGFGGILANLLNAQQPGIDTVLGRLQQARANVDKAAARARLMGDVATEGARRHRGAGG